MHPLEIGNLLGEPPSIVDRTRRHLILGDNPVGDSHSVIIFTESGCLVDDTRTRGSFDVGIAYDSVSTIFKLGSQERDTPCISDSGEKGMFQTREVF
jgi:hypothetical protein